MNAFPVDEEPTPGGLAQLDEIAQLLRALLGVQAYGPRYRSQLTGLGRSAHRAKEEAHTEAIGASTTVEELCAANENRLTLTVFNDSTAVLYLKLGRNATTTDCTVSLQAGDYYETPAGYGGVVTGVWSAVNGQARVSEIA